MSTAQPPHFEAEFTAVLPSEAAPMKPAQLQAGFCLNLCVCPWELCPCHSCTDTPIALLSPFSYFQSLCEQLGPLLTLGLCLHS